MGFPLLGPETSHFIGVVSLAGAVLLIGSAVTRSTREAGQLAGQLSGPRRVRPSIRVWLTPHRLGMTCPGRMT